MNGLVKIDFNENHEPVVSAREIHRKLGINKDFTDWYKYQVDRLYFEENHDFTTILGKSTGGRPSTDYNLTLNAAKHICMSSGGELASQIRKYFIEVENAWNRPEQVMARALQMSHGMVQSLKGEVAVLKPKAEMHDLFLSAANAQGMGPAAKALGLGRNKLFKYLRDQKILMSNNIPYQKYIDRGYFEVVEKPIDMGGQTINKTQTLVTPKGVDFIARLLTDSGQESGQIRHLWEVSS